MTLRQGGPLSQKDIDDLLGQQDKARKAIQQAVMALTDRLDWSDSGPTYVGSRTRDLIARLEDCIADLDRLMRVTEDIDLSKNWYL